MKKYLIANWKSHKTSQAGRDWLDIFAKGYHPHPGLDVILAPSMVSLESVSIHLKCLKLPNVSVASQDVSPFPRGSYTGAVAADLLKPFAKYAIVGHSERRRYFHETSQDVVNKVEEVADSSVTPIVCVEDADVLNSLMPVADIETDQLLVAYTPVDVLDFSIAESIDKVAEALVKISNVLPGRPIVYGGAINKGNVEQYLQLVGLAGVFTCSASLDAHNFLEICQLAVAAVK